MNHVNSVLRFRGSKVLALFAVCFTCLIVLSYNYNYYDGFQKQIIPSGDALKKLGEYVKKDHKQKVFEYYDRRKNLTTSNLGSILFKNVDINRFGDRKNIKFNILIWKHFNAIKSRHFFYFGSEKQDPLEHCSVKNCIFTGEDKLLEKVDVVLIHIQKGITPDKKYPGQLWVFLSDESPRNAFTWSKSRPKLINLANKNFNWSMTYRSDADVPVPYGRTIALQKPLFKDISYLELIQIIPYWEKKQRDVLITVLISNCHVPARMKLLNEMKKNTRIDVFGKCAYDPKNKNICPGHFRSGCEFMSYYLFYLVLENSMCKEYMTEKLFYNAYSNGAIPIIYGPPLKDCELLLPPNSFLHVDSFPNVNELMKEVISISQSEEKLMSYHLWRNDFEVANEHGYFGTKSYHMCRLCEALNYNDMREKLYNEERIKDFFDASRTCK